MKTKLFLIALFLFSVPVFAQTNEQSVLQTIAQYAAPKMPQSVVSAWIVMIGIIVRWIHLEAPTIAKVASWIFNTSMAVGRFLVQQGGFYPMVFKVVGAQSDGAKGAVIIVPPVVVILVIFWRLTMYGHLW